MLIPADDYPLHQTPEPIAYAGSDRNFYDRFFFNGYSPDGSVFFAAALGVYPQLNIMDAGFCLLLEGRQYNLRASREMHGDRLALDVGPIRVEIVKPLEHTRIVVAENESGLSGTMEVHARHMAVEEPRFVWRQGTRLLMDVTRATQNVSWTGFLDKDGQRIDLHECLGTRDRSWGIRPVGARDPQAVVPVEAPQFYWLWMPFNFAEAGLFCHTNDDASGESWNRHAVFADFHHDRYVSFDNFVLHPRYAGGSRRIASVDFGLVGGAWSEARQVTVKPCGPTFYMQGLGYNHPEWGHGCHHGPLRVACDEIDTERAEARLAEGELHHLHVQVLADIVVEGPREELHGQGVVEQFFMGPHGPSGFTGFLDPVLS